MGIFLTSWPEDGPEPTEDEIAKAFADSMGIEYTPETPTLRETDAEYVLDDNGRLARKHEPQECERCGHEVTQLACRAPCPACGHIKDC